MLKTAIVTDSNSGITQAEGKELGITVLPMPFYINEKMYYEDIDLTQEQFYQMLQDGTSISTSQPVVANLLELWDHLLETYDEIVHIPMSSGLSGSCETAMALAREYHGRVEVVNNQRISVTQRQSVMDAITLAGHGKTAREIREYLELTKMDSSIYIMVDTLNYLKKGGRITPAAAALGTLLRLKPVLQIQGEKLDAFAKARNVKQAKKLMIEAIHNDCIKRFGSDETGSHMWIHMAYTGTDTTAIHEFREEVAAEFPNHDIIVNPLSLSVACHIGPGALAVTCTKMMDDSLFKAHH
ncbi:DegV family protein [Lachnospiraceae bacterium CLA-AA-H215]|uniref:DegV family protein n=1 Tax=Hominifimenecus microfluidus TaxID=2885348 RepID=A0AAE3E8H0_9FIRM|nr:DegV family protein [Hominifimenecus microfluidus]MCC2230432.1 DegV family protein [Hominifimenecus microfluidus]